MAQTAHLMVHGSLSEVTRQCGDPSCACAWDPARRHGPHLYLKFKDHGKAYSVYIPPEDRAAVMQAHEAWLRFNAMANGSQRTTDNAFCRRSTATSRRPRPGVQRHVGRPDVIELCRRQLSFGDGLIAEEIGDLWEDWMRHVDTVLDDPLLLDVAYEALARRWTNSRTRGRKGTPVEVVVRLLVLKHIRNWSYAVLEREVRSNLVYRQFTRVGAAKVPDAKTLGKLGLALGPEIIEQIHQRVVAIAQEQKVISGRRMRVDTTVVETDIHYPTDASLLGDGVRVLTRAMRRITDLARRRGPSCATALAAPVDASCRSAALLAAVASKARSGCSSATAGSWPSPPGW